MYNDNQMLHSSTIFHNKKHLLFSILFPILFIALITLIIGGSIFIPRILLELSTKEIIPEVNESVPYVTNGVVHHGNDKISVSEICRKNNYTLNEVFCISKSSVYFTCTSATKEKRDWIVMCWDYKTNELKELFTLSDANTVYSINISSEYKERNGYFYDRKIVLNDFLNVITYDITTHVLNEYEYEEYVFPNLFCQSEVLDSNTIRINIGNESRTFTLEYMASHSKGINVIYSLRDKHTWNKTQCLSSFFNPSSIQVVNDKIYAVGGCLNFSGESYAVFLEYDLKNESWLFIEKAYAGNPVYNKCYVINEMPTRD